jgi:spore coat polysaccharide biosynthesis protein SpsF
LAKYPLGGAFEIGIVLQARTGSTRLPGKVLLPLVGRTMLERVIARLDGVCGVDCRVVATTHLAADDPIDEAARMLGWNVFRGSEHDVLDRYRMCATRYGLDAVVRATADNPFVDADEGSRLVRLYREAPVDHACMFPSLGGTLPWASGLRSSRLRHWKRPGARATAPITEST